MKNHKESFKRNNYGKKSGKKQKHIEKKDRLKRVKNKKSQQQREIVGGEIKLKKLERKLLKSIIRKNILTRKEQKHTKNR